MSMSCSGFGIQTRVTLHIEFQVYVLIVRVNGLHRRSWQEILREIIVTEQAYITITGRWYKIHDHPS